jgi:hypothetical protein
MVSVNGRNSEATKERLWLMVIVNASMDSSDEDEFGPMKYLSHFTTWPS